jgi:putative oxidoreductase
MTLDLQYYTDGTVLFMRLIVAATFFDSGRRHVFYTKERSESIGMSFGFTKFLGTSQMLGAVGIAFGVLTQWAALGLVLIMLGAIQKKAMVWKSGFWGATGIGWHYEVMLLAMCLVVLTTGGGGYVVWK